MKKRELNKLLVETFPEIRDTFMSYVEAQDGWDTGCFLTFEDVFMPYFYTLLDKNDEIMIAKVCKFIEDLYLLKDDYVCNVIVVGVLENLKSSNFSNKASEILLENTLKEYNEIEFWLRIWKTTWNLITITPGKR